MLGAILLTAAIAVTPAADQQHAESRNYRSAVKPWYDSGHEVWDGVPEWIRKLGKCIRQHESHHNPDAENPVSTASGAYQYLDGTWRGVARWVKHDGKFVARQYQRASDAPFWVQDAAFIHTVTRGGVRAWRGTNCGYGT